MDKVLSFLGDVKKFLDSTNLKLGDSSVSLWVILYVLVIVILLVYGSGKVKRWMVFKVLAKSNIDIGVRQAVGTIFRYVVVVIGLVVLIQTAGINLSAFAILAGALGVGVGFGLQNITNNFVSGLVILFERPIKIGDRIQVGDIAGDVVRISPRSTTVTTNDNISIIVPNSEFITSRVTNWSHSDRRVRLQVPVGVSYKSDPEVVTRILMEVAKAEPGVMDNPVSDVIFNEFGNSSLNFVLRVWTSEYIAKPNVLRSHLNYAIMRKFKENKIEIPYPQRDLHIRSGGFTKE